MSSVAGLAEIVSSAARAAGFDRAGIVPLSRFPELQYFQTWIAEGRGGEMRYLEAREPGGELKRVAVERVFPWARSVIVGAVNYHSYPAFSGGIRGDPGTRSAPPARTETQTSSGVLAAAGRSPTPASQKQACWGPRSRGRISRYAWTQRDYHDEVMERLQRLVGRLRPAAGDGFQTRCYVDTGPLIERVYARYAGLGWLGKNTCLINERLGSWLFLGAILTSLSVESEAEGGHPVLPAPDRCGTCTRCLDACPTQAFLGPRRLDASRCISYLTIEKRGPIPEERRRGIGRHVFGCDICQEVCPWNRKAPTNSSPGLQPRPELIDPDLEWLATMGEQAFRQAFRGSPLRRAKRGGLRRNAVVAMGNSGDQRFRPVLQQLIDDADETVASHAAWALRKLESEKKALPGRFTEEGLPIGIPKQRAD